MHRWFDITSLWSCDNTNKINVTSWSQAVFEHSKTSIIFMLGKYLLDLLYKCYFTGTYAYLLKPVRIHQSHCVSLNLSKPRSDIRNFPYLTKEINSMSSSSKIQVLFLLLEELQLLSQKQH